MGKKKKEELPDYTVAEMDLEGMPWNSRRMWHILPGDVGRRRRKGAGSAGEAGLSGTEKQDTQPPLSGKERWEMMGIALKAALLIGLAFGGAAFLFILFCLYVWF